MSKVFQGRWLAALLIGLSGFALLAVSFDTEARRFGGGFSSGRQSFNVMKQKQAVTPPAASAPRAAGAAGGAAACLECGYHDPTQFTAESGDEFGADSPSGVNRWSALSARSRNRYSARLVNMR